MTTAPVVLHLTRPYANVEDYLAAEAWTIDARNMLLVDETSLAPDTAIIFDVTLGDGSRPIKAEARVTGVVEPKDGMPGGTRVRFKRYSSPTKAFIERAVTFTKTGIDSGPPPPLAGPPEPSATFHAAPEASSPQHAPPEPASAAKNPIEPVAENGRRDASGVLTTLRTRSATMPETPSNREYLLEKLRQRGVTDDVTVRFQRDE